jgi:excisionase family DNA binding protein
MPSFLTIKEAAELLRCSESSISRMRSSGKLPFQKLGSNGVRFRKEHVEAMLSAPAQPAAPAKSWTSTKWTSEDAKELPASILRAPSRRAEAA